MKDPGRILILGAGPTGLGAAYRLQELGCDDFLVVEATDHPGGLAASAVDSHGFLWDLGGHVHFSHYDYYDRVFHTVMDGRLLEHERQAWVWLQDRFVPYPFQYNLHRLDPEDQARAVQGLRQASRLADSSAGPPQNFRQWIEATFGSGIAELFMLPYNRKVWGYPLESLSCAWIGERVAVPDLERVLQSLERKVDEAGWGPNRRFLYPRRGGTGAVWRGVAGRIQPRRLSFGSPVVGIDLGPRQVRLADGRVLPFDTLVSSLPLDRLAELIPDLDQEARRGARALKKSACHLVGLGLRGHQPPSVADKCWMYFPEPHSPYYRVTVLSNYSPANTPRGDGYWSLLTEVCETPHRPVDASRLQQRVREALSRDRLLPPSTQVVSVWHRREEHGYPTPTLDRDEVLDFLLPHLEARRVFSRGRFGAWKYEVSNQDHSFMQGVEVVNRILGLGDEPTLREPQRVNRAR